MSELKDRLIKEFPGKMENEETFIMTFIMTQAQKGNTPPPKGEIQTAISEMIDEGIFEKKGNLLILKGDIHPKIDIDEEDEEIIAPVIDTGDFKVNQVKILEAFQGKFENRSALIMMATMNDMKAGHRPPAKSELEKAIDELVKKGTLEIKGNMLIKKI